MTGRKSNGMLLVTLTLLAAALCGCGSIDVGVEEEQATVERKDAPTAKSAVTPAAQSDTPDVVHVQVAAPEPDQPCNGRPRIDIPAVEIPAVRTDPVRVPDQRLAGKVVPGFVVPGLDIPAQRVPAQCATEEPAPAGCFGAVFIPSVTIPGVSIPGATIPGVEVPGASQPAVREPEVTRAAVTKAAERTPGVCAQKVRPGEYRPSVYRPSTYRASAYRPALYRPALYRPSVCVDGECIPSVSVDSVSVDSVSVDSVSVPSRSLDGRTLPEVKSKCVEVFAGHDTTAYDVCTDVLFAFNRAEVRPGAAAVLRQVARSIAKRFPDRRIQVDGHTDAKGSAGYNQPLSVRRAEAVKRWLVDHGNIAADRIAVRGYGETEPVAANRKPDGSDNPAGRQRNRRVVVGVLAP